MTNEVETIKKHLKENNITYPMLSELSGVPLNTLKNIFGGSTPHPRIDTMRAIKQALGIDEKPTLAQQVLDTTLANLDIADYENLTPAEQKQVADLFNKAVQVFKKK